MTREIMNKYDSLYRERHLSMQETCMCWGIEVGDGWLELIDNLSSFLNEPVYSASIHLKSNEKEPYIFRYKYPHVIFKQVKEKFGTLRVYFDCVQPEFNEIPEEIASIPENKEALKKIIKRSYDYVDGVIGFAEHLSSLTCEVCGKRGELRDDGWMKTLCDEHYKKEK